VSAYGRRQPDGSGEERRVHGFDLQDTATAVSIRQEKIHRIIGSFGKLPAAATLC
jgi:hypothetical protein